MSEFDNTVVLYDEDGNEIEFEIVHFCEYKGETYYVLWGEDDDDEDIFLVTKKDADDDHEVVHDDEVIEFVQKSFKGGMSDLMDEVDAYAVESDFMNELNSILEGDSVKGVDEEVSEATISSDYSDTDIVIAPFDSAKYAHQSQDYFFVEGNTAYGKADYEKALVAFTKADEQGNIYATAHLGMMNYYGYGCHQNRAVAFELFKRGAEHGCPLAAAWVSECYRLGHGIEKDKTRAEKIYNSVDSDLRKMCDAGDMAALYFLGFNLVMGTGVEENEEEGVRLLTRAYEKGELRAAVQLAECYYKGWGVPKDAKKTVQLLMKHPMPTNKKAQYLLGLCNYYGNGVEENLERAFFHFKSAASLGYGNAKDYLGDCYYNGQGTSINYSEAARWYKDAADNNGIGTSAHSLAFMYLKGEGVPENEKTAMHYFLIAAEKGITQAQRIVSKEYISGENFKQDYEAARSWMQKAADQGDAEAQIMLGRYYISGFGFDDDTKAFEWFMKAADQGNAEAKYIVGGCYANQLGVPEDYRKANEWYVKAAEAGHSKAMRELGENCLLGRGIEKDSTKGIDLILQAFRLGETGASKVLAAAYYYGIENYNGQTKYVDPVEAYKYAVDAAKNEEDGDSQYILASILHKSQGKISEAIRWYVCASQNGNEAAMLELSKLYIDQGERLSDAYNMLQSLSKKKVAEAQYYLGVCYDNGFGCSKDKKEAKSFYQKAKENGFVHTASPKKKKFGLF